VAAVDRIGWVVTVPQQAMDAIDSSFASHLRHRTLHAKGVLRMTHAPLVCIRLTGAPLIASSRAVLLLWRSSAGADGAPIVENQHCQLVLMLIVPSSGM
jgi:hypothetical protein